MHLFFRIIFCSSPHDAGNQNNQEKNTQAYIKQGLFSLFVPLLLLVTEQIIQALHRFVIYAGIFHTINKTLGTFQCFFCSRCVFPSYLI